MAGADCAAGGHGQQRDRHHYGRALWHARLGRGGHRREHLLFGVRRADGRAARAHAHRRAYVRRRPPCGNRRGIAPKRLAGRRADADLGRAIRLSRAFSCGGQAGPRAGNQGARLSARARLVGAGIAAVPRVLQLFHRDLAPAHGDGADAGRPRAQGAAQLGVHVRQPGRARTGQHRLRGGDCARLLDPVRARLDLVLVRARLPAVPGVRALVLAGRESARPHPVPGSADRFDLSHRRDRFHVHGAVHRAAGRLVFGRAPDRRQPRRARFHAAARAGQRRERGGRAVAGRAPACARARRRPHRLGARARLCRGPERLSLLVRQWDRRPVYRRRGAAPRRRRADRFRRRVSLVRRGAGRDRQRIARLQARRGADAHLRCRPVGGRSGRRLSDRLDPCRPCLAGLSLSFPDSPPPWAHRASGWRRSRASRWRAAWLRRTSCA